VRSEIFIAPARLVVAQLDESEKTAMKTFEQLSETEKARAFEKCLCLLLRQVTTGAIRFNDTLNGDDLQARIDAATVRAEAMRTPWFAHEYILDTCREELESIARCDAADALYAAPSEFIMTGVAA